MWKSTVNYIRLQHIAFKIFMQFSHDPTHTYISYFKVTILITILIYKIVI